jgi:hypothetical protein
VIFFQKFYISPIKVDKNQFGYSKHVFAIIFICEEKKDLEILENIGQIMIINVFAEFWRPSWTPSWIS